ncbi:MAG: hypothetical protein WCI71_17660, partial [Bacteroidota bacterium]
GSLVLSGSGGYSNLGASLAVTLGKLVVNTTGLLEIGSGNNSITNSGGTVEFTAGTVNIFGRLTLTAGTTTISGAAISVDGQKTNILGATSNAFEISGTANVTFSSGSLTIVDPIAAPTTGSAIKIGPATGTVDLSGATFYLGDGISTTTGTSGFQILNSTTTLIPFGNIIVQTGGIAGRNVSMTSGLNIGNTLTLNSGTFTVGANTLTLNKPIGGTLSNFIAGSTSSITIAGSIAGIIVPAVVTTLNNLTLNNSNGTTLQGPLSLAGILTLTNGLLTLGSHDLTLGTVSAIGGTPSATSMVVATGTGQLRKGFAAAGSFTYPVGDNTVTAEFSPVTLNFATGTFGTGNYAGVNLVKAKYPGDPNTVNYLTRYWNISQSGITGFSCNATFQYLPTDVSGTENQIYCMKVDQVPFMVYDIANAIDHQLTATGLNTFSTFTGSMVTAPSTQASNLVFSSVEEHAITTGWTNGNGGKRVVIINTIDYFTNPADGTDPTANAIYSGSGEQVVFNGTGSSVAVTGLTGSTTYWFRAYECNGSGALSKYLTTIATDNPKSQATTAQTFIPTVTTPTATSVTSTTAILGGDITSDGGAAILERGTVWKTTTGVAITDHKLAEGGTATGVFSHERTTLPAKTQIFFKAYASNFNGPALSEEASFFTLADEPTTHVTGFAATGTGPVSIDLTWTTAATGADGYLILRKDG